MSELCTCGAVDYTLCQCSIRDGDCIAIDGSGDLNPLKPRAVIDSDSDNLMSESSGLLVKLPGYITSPDRCSAYHNANQSLSNDTGTVLALNSEYFDSNTMHDTATDNSRITIKTAGVYIITFVCVFAANATGDRQALIRKNGTTFLAGDEKKATSASFETGMSVTTQEWLEVNEYIEAVVKQTSGTSINLSATRYSPILTVCFRRREPEDG